MNKLILFLSSFVIIINCTMAQVNPPQKVTIGNIPPAAILKKDSVQSKPIRFSTTMFGGLEQGIAPNADMNYTIRYNTNPNLVIINNAEIVIKKSGLYHFECFIASKVFGANAKIHPLINVNMRVNNDVYSLLSDKIMPLAQITDEKNSYYYSELFNIDIYIAAPSTIKISKNYYAPFARDIDIYSRGWFTGYLKEE